MTSQPSVQTLGVVALVLALGAGAAALQHERERRYPRPTVDAETLYVTSGATMRRLTAGYNALAADLYWIRAIQYYGDTKRRLPAGQASGTRPGDRRAEFDLLYPLLDLTTALDPLFNIAYRFGSIFLAEAPPGGPGRPDLAIALLEKGLQHRPDKWEYMQDIGFVHYWWRHDYQAAAQWFDRASQVPGAPWFLRALSATTLAEGGDRRSSRIMWESIRATAEIEWLKNEAERRLMQLGVMDFLPTLQAAVDRVRIASGAAPTSWDVVIRARAIPGVPVDPSGTPYEIDASGGVGLSRESPLFPLPDEPQRMMSPGS